MARLLDWMRLLNEHKIPYITTGANVKRGEVSIKCPFCGSADPSFHLGISLEGSGWSCWRNRAQHSGKSPLRLIMRLLVVPYAKAREIAGLDDSYIDPEGFDAVAARIMGKDQTLVKPDDSERRFLALDSEFQDIAMSRARTRHHWQYLYDRGFDDPDRLCDEYGLFAGVSGEWIGRIILPYLQDGELVTWTGRAIRDATIRYRDLELDQSLLAAKETLFNHDAMLTGGKVLVLQEGPFDVLKVDYYGKDYGVRSVGLSTNSIKPIQAFLLQAAVGKFEHIYVMLDTKTQLGIVDSMRMQADLHFLENLSITSVPFGAGDGGNLSPDQVITWAKQLGEQYVTI